MDDFPIKGLVCSTNNNGVIWILIYNKVIKFGILPLDCFTVARGNTKFDGNLYAKIRVYCPSGCMKKPAPLWGNLIYK